MYYLQEVVQQWGKHSVISKDYKGLARFIDI
jgi:hypothetical protein